MVKTHFSVQARIIFHSWWPQLIITR